MSMKVAAESASDLAFWLKPMELALPAGLIGFPEARRLELIFNPEELPLMWLRSTENRALNFIIVEPQGLIPDYTIELGEEDATLLGITRPEDVQLFNIVNFRPEAPEATTVNLIGPIVVNRHTLVGRQVVIANFASYSARHPLLAPVTTGAGC